MTDRFLSYRSSAYALAWDCARGVFAHGDRSWWARLYCLGFVGLIIALPVTLLIVERTDARLGDVVIFGIVAFAWAAIIQAPLSQRRRAIARRQPVDTTRLLIWLGTL